ncbi:MAG: helix-turn-helix transcriptional regulator [Proteobacteria bacterium]|nr:helix-turn-helix transcriptional regulator [Pseudomonadota bacterium]
MTGHRPTYEELEKKLEDLEVKTRQYEEVNRALQKLNLQTREEAQKLEQRVVANVEDLVLPYVGRLKETLLDPDQRVYVNVVESNLTELLAPFMRQLGSKYANLTPREIEVANLVRMGTTSKEIARMLGVSKRAVEFHRDRLRKKLGLKKSKRNLRAYLASLT